MSEHAAKLESLRRHIAELGEANQREIRRAHRELLWMVKRHGEAGTVAIALLAAEILETMDKQDDQPQP